MPTRRRNVLPTSDGFTLVDLGSTNGTSVNNRRVAEHALRDGDIITIGSTVIHFEAS